ncbi:MAG TPA: DUF2214 family protein [Bordetella sp.]
MLQDALLAWLHYLAIFLLAGLLCIEAALLRPGLAAQTALRLARYDLAYGLSALAVLATGLLRMAYGAKGAAFYLGNPWFHAKIGLFVLVGLCSVIPTLRLLRWRRQARNEATFAPSAREIARVRRWVMIEAHLLILLPLCAVMMARGIGLS